MIKTFSLYFHTLRYLKWRQIFWRLFYKFYHPKPHSRVNFSLRMRLNPWRKSIAKLSAKIAENQYRFLNETKDVANPKIWRDKKIDKLWCYHLHYFDEKDLDLMHRWIRENPPIKGVGWDSYPISLRLVNWIKWSLEGEELADVALKSLILQACYLRKRLEYHLLGNHLLANAKALIFAGLFFKNKETDQWLKKGFELFDEALQEQILPNGGHMELSPMYHAIVLQDILDVVNICHVYHVTIKVQWIEVVRKMFRWLSTVTFPTGRLAFFNDTAMQVAPTIQELFEYAHRLNLSISCEPIQCADGYFYLQHGELLLMADAAAVGPDYLPGHAHADTLSFELMYRRHLIFVNSGVSTYEDNEVRLAQRGTAAHNTVVIDHQNSSEVWKSFRVARRARMQKVDLHQHQGCLVLHACHEGYHRLKGTPTHCRQWILGSNRLVIEDTILGQEKHEIQLYFHTAPDIFVKKIDAQTIELFLHEVCIAKMSFQSIQKIIVEDSFYHETFGSSEKNKTIVASFSGKIPAHFKTEVVFY